VWAPPLPFYPVTRVAFEQQVLGSGVEFLEGFGAVQEQVQKRGVGHAATTLGSEIADPASFGSRQGRPVGRSLAGAA
jgi:hypothetical protein